ncbi:MAG: 16S rRNA (cytosine(1402)-N(4))-methyltransferase RsmH [Alphaproteobacteria bacterium]|nr:16S rRNA (cytosine(1402)-N(4))-methyltransferase RsmH [Alphaproteobacteria bacterium SS10]
MNQAAAPHLPVLLNQVLAAMPNSQEAVAVDGTFGAGGYSRAMLEAGLGQLYGVDRDPSVGEFAALMSKDFGPRFKLLQGPFSDMEDLLAEQGVSAVDGIVLDLGVSSMQLDQPERGFSFRFDGPLDMRMADTGETAADVVNQAEETELADIIYQLGEERRARQVARAIVHARAEAPIETTLQLAEIVRAVVKPGKGQKIDPATRTFMALRLHVNDELGEVQRGLRAAERLLKEGGVLAVVTFHSLEDRIVKLFMRDRSTPPDRGSRHLPATPTPSPQGHSQEMTTRQPSFRLPGRQDNPLLGGRNGATADEDELARNPRSRSARLRVAFRTDAPAWESAA